MDWTDLLGKFMVLALVIWAAWAMYHYEGFRKGVGYTALGFFIWMVGWFIVVVGGGFIILKLRGN